MKRIWQSSNPSELAFADEAERRGWVVHRNGWPDFLLERNGKIVAVEIKRPTTAIPTRTGRPQVGRASKPTREQRRIHRLLRQHGIPVLVIRVDPSGHPVMWDQQARTWARATWDDAYAEAHRDGRPGRRVF